MKDNLSSKNKAGLLTLLVNIIFFLVIFFMIAWKETIPPIPEYGIEIGISEYIAITLLVATKTRLGLNTTFNSEQLKQNLQALGSIGANDLMALEVIRQPEGEGESLSAQDLVTAYPNLKHL